jgi:enhancer of mRNA-decapping protein 4
LSKIFNCLFSLVFYWKVLISFFCSASVDGRVFIWKINEGPDEEDKPQITGKIGLAIQIEGMGESIQPRVCWHPHKQVIRNL